MKSNQIDSLSFSVVESEVAEDLSFEKLIKFTYLTISQAAQNLILD